MNIEKIKPVGMKILAEKLPQEEKTESGIYIPNSEPKPICKCLVVAVGYEEDTFEVGDKVLVGRYAGTPVELGNNKNYVMLEHNEVLAFIEE